MEWHKSSFSTNGNSVGVYFGIAPASATAKRGEQAHEVCDVVAIRNSEEPWQGNIVFSAAKWQAFIAGVKAGEFDNG